MPRQRAAGIWNKMSGRRRIVISFRTSHYSVIIYEKRTTNDPHRKHHGDHIVFLAMIVHTGNNEILHADAQPICGATAALPWGLGYRRIA